MSQGLGLRYSFMGPFETIDLNADGRKDGALAFVAIPNGLSPSMR